MVTPRTTSLALGGLITTPNPSGVYPEGAARVFTNVRSVGPNLCGAMRAPVQDALGGSVGNEIVKISPLTSGKYCSIQLDTFGTNWFHYGENTTGNLYTLPSYISAAGLYTTDGFISPIVARGKWFTNTRQGVLALDTTSPQSAGDRTLRSTALPQPSISAVVLVNGATLPANTNLVVGLQAVLTRDSAGEYPLTSPPSLAVRLWNGNLNPQDPQLTIKWAFSDDVRAGDVIEIYMTQALSAPDYSVDPGTTGFCVLRHTIQTFEAASASATVVVRQPLTVDNNYTPSGATIYTASTRDTAAGANFQPPLCRVMCPWNNYVLYGNVTEDPTLVLDVPAGIGELTTAYTRQYGIGARNGSGSITLGNPTVTGVSAADMVGIAVGQYFDASTGLTSFPASARVISTTSSSFTMSVNATTGAGVWRLQDSVQVDGVDYMAGALGILAFGLASSGLYQLQADSTVPRNLATNVFTVGETLSIRPIHHASSFTIRATNGANYSPILPDYTSTALTVSRSEKTNMLRYSKYNQPEAVPYVNELRVGLGAIIAMQPTTDCIYVACTDGLFRVTGLEGVWRADPVDSELIIAGPQASDVLFDRMVAYTNRGLISYGSDGIKLLSKGVVDELMPGAAYQATRFPIVMADSTREEITTLFKSPQFNTTPAVVYVYSSLYNQFSKLDISTIATNAQRITAAAMRRDTSIAGRLPYPLFGLFPQSTAPVVYRDDSTGNTLPVEIVLQRFGDPTTTKQWIDCSWLFNKEVAGLFDVFASWNGVANGSHATTKATRVDSRATLGIPRAEAIRASIEPGCTIASISTDIDLLGISLRVVPKTTQTEVR